MPTQPSALDLELMLDANSVAGKLEEIFGRDVTASLTTCNLCGNITALGALKAFVHAPGVVLRCATCEQVVLRFTTTPEGIYLDVRGLSCTRLGGQRSGDVL